LLSAVHSQVWHEEGRAEWATRFANTVANFFTAFFFSDTSFLAVKTVPEMQQNRATVKES
jgi:TorA maturation chaperone TorD